MPMTVSAGTAAVTTPPAGGCAVVFPGQGSQRPAMAAPWRDTAGFGRWAEADAILGWDVSSLGTDADAVQLRDPLNCQVALFVHSAVMLEAWRDAGGRADVVAGHSLGEYSALLAAGVVSFADGLRLVERRATATATAAAAQPGGMIACLGGDTAALRTACEESGAAVANDNAEGQLVVAGDEAALERFTVLAGAHRAKVVRLEVGAAYHSPAMSPAAEAFAPSLAATAFADAAMPVISNVDAQPHSAAADWPGLLLAQLTAPVRWRETVSTLATMGTDEVVELGASPVLTPLVKRTAPALRRRSVVAPGDLVAA